MVTCCDTSFLFSLYGQDQHTARAKAEVARLPGILAVTPLNEFEFLNAVRLAMFRRVLPAADGAMMQAAFLADVAAQQQLISPACNLHAVCPLTPTSARLPPLNV